METNNTSFFAPHITYIISDGKYVGYETNHPGVLIQADSLDELKEELRIVFKAWLERHLEKINEPIGMREVSIEEWMKRCGYTKRKQRKQ